MPPTGQTVGAVNRGISATRSPWNSLDPRRGRPCKRPGWIRSSVLTADCQDSHFCVLSSGGTLKCVTSRKTCTGLPALAKQDFQTFSVPEDLGRAPLSKPEWLLASHLSLLNKGITVNGEFPLRCRHLWVLIPPKMSQIKNENISKLFCLQFKKNFFFIF